MAKSLDRDKFGYCVKCHKHLLREVVIANEVKVVPTADADREVLLMNDGSQMGISICRSCKYDITDDDFEYIMDAVVKGWDWETDQLVADPLKVMWDKEKKDKHMAQQRKLGIVSKSENLSKSEREKRLDKFKKDKSNKE